mmetsp:Transcript_12936/g.19461  ORF Transcript_12936/g.19461 Transcript_12936/m.19461 type:complete len:344 (+) Transcript_12936:247-1278(+)|eukprot:CAMPEP_0185037924 /NCGR_PEP_ID=MMETSP1103-20130426/32969_1 /TAXON_ID=36769 /ORGANISM="Paraphysomonas bandaiensis, Strain Caron Lab Isolate" /LENGTH=343 /DNA_ID=CAMNT_0027576133 /DNA_START=162 /DNA_END=1193 /DNA_ORIENTATION=+
MKDFNFWQWVYVPFFTVWISYLALSGLLRGKQQSPFYQSTPFLVTVRFIHFLTWWVLVYDFSFHVSLVLLLYLPWLLDLSEFSGSRISDTMRRSWIGKWMKSFFPCKVVKTAELNSQCIIGIHHHGVLPWGSVINVGTEASGFESIFPALKHRVIIAASYCFWVPFFRDLLLAGGVVDCNKWSVEKWLSKGYTVAVFPGGAREGLYANPDEDFLDLRRKRGFLKLGMKYGIPVVPAFSFNEVDHHQQLHYLTSLKYPLLAAFRTLFHDVTGIIVPILYNIIPRGVSTVVTVFGEAVHLPHTHGEEPSEESVDKAMEVYIKAVESLYYKHAGTYNSQPRKLIIT